jgi:hypothetical protein
MQSRSGDKRATSEAATGEPLWLPPSPETVGPLQAAGGREAGGARPDRHSELAAAGAQDPPEQWSAVALRSCLRHLAEKHFGALANVTVLDAAALSPDDFEVTVAVTYFAGPVHVRGSRLLPLDDEYFPFELGPRESQDPEAYGHNVAWFTLGEPFGRGQLEFDEHGRGWLPLNWAAWHED